MHDPTKVNPVLAKAALDITLHFCTPTTSRTAPPPSHAQYRLFARRPVQRHLQRQPRSCPRPLRRANEAVPRYSRRLVTPRTPTSRRMSKAREEGRIPPQVSATVSTRTLLTRGKRIIKKIADDVFEVTGSNPLLDIALALEEVALHDEYFVERKLYPNVDFYSGIIYRRCRSICSRSLCPRTCARLASAVASCSWTQNSVLPITPRSTWRLRQTGLCSARSAVGEQQ